MRRILLALLVAILPFQFVWATATGYCQHESGAAAKHFGHHEHQHRTASGEVAKDLKAKSLAGADDDCSICHLSAAPSIVAAQVEGAAPAVAAPHFTYQRRYRSHIPIGLERPDRGIAV